MSNICQIFVRYNSEARNQDNYLKQRYAKDMPKICQRQLPKAVIRLQKISNQGVCERYAKDILQIQNNYLKQRYVKDLLGVQLRSP